MSAVRLDRGPDQNPWLLHASTVEEIDEYLTSSVVRREHKLVDDLLDLRNSFTAKDRAA